jgi:hypothetical protein
MELLDRYLQAVKFWLPREQKQDIIAELSEDLQSQIDDKETALGRKLNESEIESILKQRGRPLLVANRFLPQQHVIGPVLYPIYAFVLKIVALCYLVPWILVWIGLMAFSPAYRAERTSAGWLPGLLSTWSTFWVTALIAVGAVTVLFAILERVQGKSRFLEDWSPRKLPPVRNPNQIPRSGSILELAAVLGFAIWWVPAMSSRLVLDRPEVRVLMAPVWSYFFWGYAVLAVAIVALSGTNLARPYWTVSRASLRLVMDCVGSALFCWALKVNIVQEIWFANASSAHLIEITNRLNFWMGKILPYAVLVGIVIAASDVYRIVRVKSRNARLVQDLAAVIG